MARSDYPSPFNDMAHNFLHKIGQKLTSGIQEVREGFPTFKKEEPVFKIDLDAEASKVISNRPVQKNIGTSPETIKQGIKKVAVETLRAFPREGAGAVLEGAGRILGTELELRPQDSPFPGLARVVFGDEPVRSISRQGQEVLESAGVETKTAERFGLPLGVAFVVGDLLPGGQGKKLIVERIAKITDATTIAKHLKGLGVADSLIDDAAKNLARVSQAGEVSNSLDDLLEQTSKLVKERGFITTVKEAPQTAEKVRQEVRGFYEPITNKQIVEEAQQLIKTNVDEAIRIAKSPEPATARSNAIAQELIVQFQNQKRFQDAIDIVETTAQKATSQGQAIQALSLYNKLTPEGVLRFAQRQIDRANASTILEPRKIKLSDQAAKEIIGQAAKAKALPEGRQKTIETAKLLQKIQDQIPPTLGKRMATIQTLGQLLNPKTFIRNIGGNIGFAGIENVKDLLAIAIDSPLSLVTGKRTKTLPSVTTQAKGAARGLVEGLQDAFARVDTSGVPTKFDLPKTSAFGDKGILNKIGRAAEFLLNIELKATDRAFYKAAYDGEILNQMRINKLDSLDGVTEAMKEVAHHTALYRTFQDDSTLSKVFVGIKKALNVHKDFGVGDIVLKYPRTPANLLARGIEYSPGGFVTALYEAARPLMGKPFQQREFVESFSRALTGTGGLVGMGALLHRLEIITGKPEEDRDIRGLQRITGLGDYRINVSALKRFVLSGLDVESAKRQQGDMLLTFDWFQPQAIAISIGANIDESSQAKHKTGTEKALGMVDVILTSLAEGVDTLGEQPLISGLQRVMRTKNFADSAKETFKQILSSFVPTLLSQITQLIDNTQRNSYSPETISYAFNLAKNKIPGLAQTLPPSVDVFGEDLERYQGGSNNLFNVFFNPAFSSSVQMTPEAKLVFDLMSETGETKHAPRAQSYTQTINGESKKLTPTQITAFQRYTGRVTRQLFASFAADQRFQSLPPEEKVNYLSNTLTDIGVAGRVMILGHRPEKLSKRAQQIIMMYR